MTLNPVQRATLRIALSALEDNPDADLPTSDINAIIGPTWAAEIAARKSNYMEANAAASSLTGLLSSSAMDYWREARSVLSYGRLALSMGSRKAELALSRKCEALEESFSQRVAPSEQGKFLIHDISGSNWDDRWHNCVDFYFPILRGELLGQTVVANPLRAAQCEVLADILRPDLNDPANIAEAARLREAGKKLRNFMERLNR